MSLELIVQALRDETGHEARSPLQSAGAKKTPKKQTNKKTKYTTVYLEIGWEQETDIGTAEMHLLSLHIS